MKEVEIVVRPTGQTVGMYKDELKPVFEAIGKMKVKRASKVEWEDVPGQGAGWTVRAEHDPELAIRCQLSDGAYHKVVSRGGEILLFDTREAALENEVEFFWELIPQPQPAGLFKYEKITLTRKEFDSLPEYSSTIPTGTAIGKRWKCKVARCGGAEPWVMGEYVEETQEPWKSKGYVGIKWREIVLS